MLYKFGNVQGGLRSPFLDAPTSTWYGTATGASFCFIAGYERPLPQDVIDGLYRNHSAYVKAVKDSARTLARQSFLTDYDAGSLIREAAQSDTP